MARSPKQEVFLILPTQVYNRFNGSFREMVADYLLPHPSSIKQPSFISTIKNIPRIHGNPTRLDPKIIDFFAGPELTPKLAIKTTMKGIWQTRDGQVRPACGLFPAIFLSPTTLCYLTMWLNFCYSLPMTVALAHCYPLPCYLATRQSVTFQSINRDFPYAVDYLPYVPGYMPSLYFAIGYAFFVMLHGQGLVLTSLSVSIRLFTTKAPQATRHALGTSRPSSITHLGTRKYPTQPSPLECFPMLVS